jgi:hypothetical protein
VSFFEDAEDLIVCCPRATVVDGSGVTTENDEVEDVARVRGPAGTGERKSLEEDALELDAPEALASSPGAGGGRSLPCVFALPMTPPRSFALRTSVAKSGLLAVPGERNKLRLLVPLLVWADDSSRDESKVFS